MSLENLLYPLVYEDVQSDFIEEYGQVPLPVANSPLAPNRRTRTVQVSRPQRYRVCYFVLFRVGREPDFPVEAQAKSNEVALHRQYRYFSTKQDAEINNLYGLMGQITFVVEEGSPTEEPPDNPRRGSSMPGIT